jgi:hypothetical protein
MLVSYDDIRIIAGVTSLKEQTRVYEKNIVKIDFVITPSIFTQTDCAILFDNVFLMRYRFDPLNANAFYLKTETINIIDCNSLKIQKNSVSVKPQVLTNVDAIVRIYYIVEE